MTVSSLADLSRDIPAGNRWNPRESAISGFGIHHNAGVDAYGQATAPDREVSANYWITNDGTIIPNVDEEYRAFTSGMAGYPAGTAADHRNITVEVSNTPEGVANRTWEISDAALESLAQLIADVYQRYGLGAVVRGADRGIGIHSDWVPTECPGPYMKARLGDVIARAEALRSGIPTGGGTAAPVLKPKEWYEMLKPFNGKSTRSKPQVVRGNGERQALTFKDSHDEDKWGDRTIARGPGHIIGTGVNIEVEGDPETRVVFELVRETGENKDRVRLAGPVRAVVDEFGKAGVQLTHTGELQAGQLVRALAQVENGKQVAVTGFYWNGETA